MGSRKIGEWICERIGKLAVKEVSCCLRKATRKDFLSNMHDRLI